MKSNPLQKAIEMSPSLNDFAKELGTTYQVVQQWRVNGVPAKWCPAIERLTERAVTCERLRPDVDWAYLRVTDKKANAGF